MRISSTSKFITLYLLSIIENGLERKGIGRFAVQRLGHKLTIINTNKK